MRTGTIFVLAVLAGVFILTAGCKSRESQKSQADVRQSSEATSPNTPSSNENRGKVIFRDDFSNSASGWEKNVEKEYYIVDYVDDEYQIKNVVDRQITKGTFEGREVSDGDFAVTARKISGPDDIRFGIFARYTGQNFLEASVLADGRCALWEARYEGYSLTKKPEFRPCASVRRGNEANDLRLVVTGAQATFYVNGEKVTDVTNIGTEGRVFGLFATSTAEGSDVRFDNFELREPPPVAP